MIVWAARRDFSARDFIQVGNVGLVTVADSRFIVRDLGPAMGLKAINSHDDEGFPAGQSGACKQSRRTRAIPGSFGPALKLVNSPRAGCRAWPLLEPCWLHCQQGSFFVDFAKTSEIRQKKLSARLRHCYHYLQQE